MPGKNALSLLKPFFTGNSLRGWLAFSMLTSTQKQLLFILGLFFAWLLSYLFLWPVGDFTCIDSWYYAFPVKSLIYEGRFLLPGLTGPNIFFQVSMGYCLSMALGDFSFDYLRILTALTAFSGSLCFYLLIRPHLSSQKWLAIALLLFIFQPLYFFLSFTFMSDVYFCVLALWASWALKVYFDRSQITYFWIFILFASLSFLNRQIGLLLFPVALVVFGIKKRKKIALQIVLLMVPIFLFWAVEKVFKPGLEMTSYYFNPTPIILDKVLSPEWKDLRSFVKRSLATLLYLGFFLIPLSVLVIRQSLRGLSKIKRGILLVLLLLGTYLGALGNVFSPDRGNVFYNLGLGPQLLKDIFIKKQFSDTIYLGGGFEYPAIFLGLLSSFSLFLFFQKKWKEGKMNSPYILFLLLFNLVILPLSFLFHVFFDRYLLFSLISLMIAFWVTYDVQHLSWQNKPFFILSVILWSGFSLLATKDYFNWQKAKTRAYAYLTDQNVTIHQTDAGFEINGWENAGPDYQKKEGKSWWFVEEDEYCLSFGPIEGYKVIHSEPYFRSLALKKQDMLVLKKTEPAARQE